MNLVVACKMGTRCIGKGKQTEDGIPQEVQWSHHCCLPLGATMGVQWL